MMYRLILRRITSVVNFFFTKVTKRNEIYLCTLQKHTYINVCVCVCVYEREKERERERERESSQSCQTHNPLTISCNVNILRADELM